MFVTGAFLFPVSAFSDDIAPFPNAVLDMELHQQVTSYPVISSSMKKVNGVVMADSEQWLDGALDRKLYLLPSGKSSDEAYRFFTRQFKQLGVEPVFSCERFSCGASNFWANNIFDIARLYGLDKEQAYYLGQKETNGKITYYLTYTVKRGNRREYALVDIFTVGKARGARSNQVAMDDIPVNTSDLERSEAYKVLLKTLKNQAQPLLITVESASARNTSEVDRLSERLNASQNLLQSRLNDDGIDSQQFRIQTIIGDLKSASLHWQVLQ